jgi:uncharacterized protein with von Willebrand factor type A (vWA) domain
VPEDVAQLYAREVEPYLAPDAAKPSDRVEAWVRVLARRALLLAREEILPRLGEAIDADVRAVSRLLAHSEELQRNVRRVIEAGELGWAHRLVGGAWELQPDEGGEAIGAVDLQLARRVVDGWLDHVCTRDRDRFATESEERRANAAGLDDCTEAPSSLSRVAWCSSRDDQSTSSPGAAEDRQARLFGDALEGDPTSWLQCGGTLEETADLLSELRACLPPRACDRRRGVADRGVSLDLRAAMAASARQGSPERIWRRRAPPDHARAAFLLLVDLSGSMRGDPVLHALRAARVFAEALTTLELPCSVLGFQDECIEVLPFDTPFDRRARAVLSGCVEEPSGRRIGGRNEFRFNDDGPCLREAARRLLARQEPDRVLIVLSDGLPEGRRSNLEDLKSAVLELADSMTLIGVGVGQETGHVRAIYPHSVPNVPLHQLARRVGRILRNTLS